MHNIVFRDRNAQAFAYLGTIYNLETNSFSFLLEYEKQNATIFEIDDYYNTIAYGDKYLSFSLNSMTQTNISNFTNTANLVFNTTPTVFSLIKNQLTVQIGDGIKLTLTSSLKFIDFDSVEDNTICATIEKYDLPSLKSINIVVFDCVGNDSPEVEYLKSLTTEPFESFAIEKTLSRMLNSYKHTWNMYLGFSALNGSSTVNKLKDLIDYYLKAGYAVNLYGHGYGGAIVVKALSLPQTPKSILQFGYLAKGHLENLYVYTFGSYLMSNNSKIKQYMLINDPNMTTYTNLKKPSKDNHYFLNGFMVDNLQNVIWVQYCDSVTNGPATILPTANKYIELIANMISHD